MVQTTVAGCFIQPGSDGASLLKIVADFPEFDIGLLYNVLTYLKIQCERISKLAQFAKEGVEYISKLMLVNTRGDSLSLLIHVDICTIATKKGIFLDSCLCPICWLAMIKAILSYSEDLIEVFCWFFLDFFLELYY